MYLLVKCKNDYSERFADPTYIIFAVISNFVLLTYLRYRIGYLPPYLPLNFMASVEAGCLI